MIAQSLAALIGIWMMVAPAALGYGGMEGRHDHIAGPLIATFAIVACWECTRGVRWLNACAAVWLLAAPWLLGFESAAATINASAAAPALFGLSMMKGRIRHSFGGGWRALWREPNQ
jgi:hypothetical protein